MLNQTEIKSFQKNLKEDQGVDKLIQFSQVLGGKTRAKILCILASVDRLCVTDLAEILNSTTSAISHQLRILKKIGLVECEQTGKMICYWLKNPKNTKKVLEILKS